MRGGNQITVHALVIKYKNIAREIVSHVSIGKAFNEKSIPQNPPLDETYKAVWDTGATASCITEKLANRLSLEQIGKTFSQGVTGTAECRKFLISLYLPNEIVIPELEVSDCSGDIGCDILIGMDVIGLGDFAVSNFNGRTTFTFRVPSVGEADYTTQKPNQYQAVKISEPGRNALCSCGSRKKYKKCCGR